MRHSRPVAPLVISVLAIALSSCSKESAPPVRTYSMGDRVELGHLVYTVYETRWMTQIGAGPTARIPENRFFLVRLSVGNTGSGEVLIPDITLEDDTGTSFPELTDGDGVPDFQGVLRPVSPGESVAGNVLFDAQPGHYKLHIFDEQSQRTALVDIPLSFRSDSPDVPSAEAAPK
jgi:hypothetical protein